MGDEGNFLSLGQAQRLSLARALVSKPELLLLDDPVRNLHDSVAQEVMENIHNLPCTTIFTTNEPAMIKVRPFKIGF